MRFAFVTTAAAALIAVPLAVAASGPQMSEAAFIDAVRCVAYHDIAQPGAPLAEAKWRLNSEARRQAPETAAVARVEASAAARLAATEQGSEQGEDCDGFIAANAGADGSV